MEITSFVEINRVFLRVQISQFGQKYSFKKNKTKSVLPLLSVDDYSV